MRPLRSFLLPLALALGAAGAALTAFPSAPGIAVLPDWSLTGVYDVQSETGRRDLAGEYRVRFGEQVSSITISYVPNSPSLTSIFGVLLPDDRLIFVRLRASTEVDSEGVERITIEEDAKRPRFTFEGTSAPGGGDLVGTHVLTGGFAGATADSSGPFTFTRFNPNVGNGKVRLRMSSRMDDKGRITGGLDTDGETETKARVNVFAGRILENGKIRGRLKTNDEGSSTAKVKITGAGWTATLSGPVDVDGFHASADVRGAGFSFDDVPFVLPVIDGPPPPPPPPPPPAKNQLSNCFAQVSAGQITISRGGLPAKFFGKSGTLTITFHVNDLGAPFHADPSSDGIATPRRVIAALGSSVFETAVAPSDVTIDVKRFSSIPGGTIEALCTGTIHSASGAKKTVDVLVVATVQ